MSDINSQPVLDRQAFTIAGVTFLDQVGEAYTPGTVEKRVVVSPTGFVITNWTTLSGFVSGNDVPVTATEMALHDTTLLVEKHVVLVVGDRNTASENPLRVIVQVKNRERVP